MKDTNDHQQFCNELWDATEPKFLIRPLSLITHGYCFSIVKVFFIIECLYTHVNTVFMGAVFQIVLKQT